MKRKVGDRLREIIQLIRLIQPLGKARIFILTAECFLLIIIAGFIFETLCIEYFVMAVIGTLLYVVLITCRALGLFK